MTEENEDVKYDTVLENMGSCGKFQISRVLLIVFILFNVTISQYNFLFYSLIPNYRYVPTNKNFFQVFLFLSNVLFCLILKELGYLPYINKVTGTYNYIFITLFNEFHDLCSFFFVF